MVRPRHNVESLVCKKDGTCSLWNILNPSSVNKIIKKVIFCLNSSRLV